MSVQQLPHGVIKLISSTQVISSVSTVVKELIENAIDGRASVIDIKLEKIGLEKIEVRDNGCGISKTDALNVCLPNYTSKIYSYDDLDNLESYGFRGEALNSLCAVSQLCITTKTEFEDVASTYTYDNNGTVREVQPSHYMKGTIVSVTNLFKNVPVRRQYYENTRKASEELKKIEKIVKLLSVIHPKLRVTLAHNKCLIWQKTAVFSLRQSLMQVYPHVVLKNLVEFKSTLNEMTVEMLICKRDCNWSVLCQPLSEAILFFVNKRPVKDKKVEKVVLEEMTHLFASTLPHNKCPLTLISLTLSPQNLDVNVEPDKSKIFMKNHEEVLKQIRESIMLHFYEQPVGGDTQESETNDSQESCKKRKLNDDSADVVLQKRIQYESIPSVDVSSQPPLSDISNRRDGNCDSLANDLLALDASQFEESSGDKELFSIQKSSVESQNTDLEIHQVKENVPDDSVSDSAETQFTLSFDIPFESIVEKGNGQANPENVAEARDSLSCDTNLNSLEKNESVENKFGDFALPENSTKTPNENVPTVGEEEARLNQTTLSSSTPETVLNQTTLSQWSKGLVNIGGDTVQGGAIITNALNARLMKNNDDAPKMEKRPKSTNIFSPSLTERSISSQMGRKDLKGLTNFARTVRSEIVKENPGMSFTKVASELANRWRNLRDDEKDMFSEKAKAEKSAKMNPVNSTPTPLIKKTYISVNLSMDYLRTQSQKLNSTASHKYTYVVGPLRKESEWVCKIGNEIAAVHIHQLKKNVLVHRDLCHFSVPSQILDVPLQIDALIIGNELWNVLLALEKCNLVEQSRFLISDPRILKNGFKIVVEKESSESFKAVITETANECQSFVVETLVETLKLIKVCEDVQNCRPAVIKRFILVLNVDIFYTFVNAADKNHPFSRKSEILRKTVAKFAQPQDCNVTNHTEIEELLAYWAQQMSEISVCPSLIPTSVKLHSLSRKNQ